MTLHINNPELEAQLEKFAEATGDKSKTLEQQASELLVSALRERNSKLQNLREKLAVGEAQLDEGEGTDGEVFFKELLCK